MKRNTPLPKTEGLPPLGALPTTKYEWSAADPVTLLGTLELTANPAIPAKTATRQLALRNVVY